MTLAAAAQETVAADPIECWWRLDRSAIYIGEQFSLLLTCSVIDAETVRVVVDEAALDQATVLLSPFEVLGGERYRDIRNNARRFFQHRYNLRLVGEEFFGTGRHPAATRADVSGPELGARRVVAHGSSAAT